MQDLHACLIQHPSRPHEPRCCPPDFAYFYIVEANARITSYIINYFTRRDTPALTVYDSYIVLEGRPGVRMGRQTLPGFPRQHRLRRRHRNRQPRLSHVFVKRRRTRGSRGAQPSPVFPQSRGSLAARRSLSPLFWLLTVAPALLLIHGTGC